MPCLVPSPGESVANVRILDLKSSCPKHLHKWLATGEDIEQGVSCWEGAWDLASGGQAIARELGPGLRDTLLRVCAFHLGNFLSGFLLPPALGALEMKWSLYKAWYASLWLGDWLLWDSVTSWSRDVVPEVIRHIASYGVIEFPKEGEE